MFNFLKNIAFCTNDRDIYIWTEKLEIIQRTCIPLIAFELIEEIIQIGIKKKVQYDLLLKFDEATKGWGIYDSITNELYANLYFNKTHKNELFVSVESYKEQKMYDFNFMYNVQMGRFMRVTQN